eukprot:CAMPEP_0170315284 /NCGR_PEP_ID=MMETSP0116_2-20130129/58237_1 /TAXON_ID=400756 /ORGANISM="Durinskia baltica, Strain CSIRO CS-38" /LENGTH=138 /DNA_ID=CAMNT_0010567777 /DNA_START=73 /DNA_END=486 /DNA_ORIENTATION=+
MGEVATPGRVHSLEERVRESLPHHQNLKPTKPLMSSDAAPGSDAALSKTKLCKFFSAGRCKHGKACQFAHGEHQLRPQPDFFRTQLCYDFMERALCRYGDRCRFTRHQLPPPATPVVAGSQPGAVSGENPAHTDNQIV